MSASENQIIVYQPNETARLNVWFMNMAVWLTHNLKIAMLAYLTNKLSGVRVKRIIQGKFVFKNRKLKRQFCNVLTTTLLEYGFEERKV